MLSLPGGPASSRTPPCLSPSTPTAAELSPAAISVTLTPHGSAAPRSTTPSLDDGAFTFRDLPAGSHLLEVTAPGLAYHPVWVWVKEGGDAETATTIEAAYADAPARLLPTEPLALRPAARTSPFDMRATFDPVAFAKTPYGMLLLFVAFAVLVLPRLRIDPDEYEELLAEQAARRSQRDRRVEGGGDGETSGASSPARRIQGAGGGGRGGAGAVRRGAGGGGGGQD